MLPLLTLLLLAPVQDSALTVRFLDVGQGDAILLTSPAGRHVLVDAGPSAEGVAGRLATLGIARLELVVATHPHADHIGGLAAVLRRFPTRHYLDNGDTHTTQTYRRTMMAVEASGATYLLAEPRTIRLDGVALHVLPTLPRRASLNNRSVGVVVEYGAFRLLLTGDAEYEALNHWRGRGVPRVHVLKAAHHGARNGVTPGFLQATRPAIVVIQVGRNSYGHPDPWALRYYAAAAAGIFRTDVVGEIVIRADTTGRFTVTTPRSGETWDFPPEEPA